MLCGRIAFVPSGVSMVQFGRVPGYHPASNAMITL